MISVVIIDDEKQERETLSSYVKSFFKAENQDANVQCFACGRDFFNHNVIKPDILFLDIQMEGMNGIEVARAVRAHDEEAVIIFITNMVQYAIEGYSVKALNFILKPVNAFSVSNELKKALKSIERKRSSCIQITNNKQIIVVNTNDIFFIETSNRKLLMHTKQKSLYCNETMQVLENKLQPYGFHRCHNAYLVNLGYVETIAGNLTVVNGQQIPVSKHRHTEFVKALTKYFGDVL